MVYINDLLCTGCGECVDICPSDAFIFQNNHAYIDQERCQGCEACVEFCPEDAVQIGEPEPASQEVKNSGNGPELLLKEKAILGIPSNSSVANRPQLQDSTESSLFPVIRMLEMVPTDISPQEHAPIPVRELAFPAIGSALLWIGRELVPRFADLALGYLDRRIQISQQGQTMRVMDRQPQHRVVDPVRGKRRQRRRWQSLDGQGLRSSGRRKNSRRRK